MFLQSHDMEVRASGIVTLSNFEILDNGADLFLQDAHGISRKEFFHTIELLGHKTNERTLKNKIQITGLDVLAMRLAGDTTYTGAINYGCLGTSSTAVSESDGQLYAEVYRQLFATRQQSNESVTVDFYYSKSSTNGTYQEFGVCIDGTGAANSGQFYNRVLTGGWTKSSSVGMTVSVQLDLVSA